MTGFFQAQPRYDVALLRLDRSGKTTPICLPHRYMTRVANIPILSFLLWI